MIKISKKTAYTGSMALGLLSLSLLSGCGQAGAVSTPGDALLTSPAEGTTQSQAGAIPAAPVRVSRSFFSANINGTIRVQGQAPESGPVRWNESPAGADSLGCASFSQANGVGLCFELMNDVDSFGVNDREMAQAGIETYLTERLGQPCPGSNWEVTLANAARLPATVSSRAVTSFMVQFTAQAPANSGCAVGPLNVEFAFQK